MAWHASQPWYTGLGTCTPFFPTTAFKPKQWAMDICNTTMRECGRAHDENLSHFAWAICVPFVPAPFPLTAWNPQAEIHVNGKACRMRLNQPALSRVCSRSQYSEGETVRRKSGSETHEFRRRRLKSLCTLSKLCHARASKNGRDQKHAPPKMIGV